MDAVREKLLDLEKQYNEINEKLTDEEVVKNPIELTKLSKEEARLSQPVEALPPDPPARPPAGMYARSPSPDRVYTGCRS